MALVEEFRFKNSFIFKYSERPGTKANGLWPDDIPDAVKKRRNNELLELQNRISEEDNAEFIGTTVEVLCEGASKTATKRGDADGDAPSIQLVGRTDCDRIVVFNGNRRLAGSMVEVDVHDTTTTTLLGSIVTRQINHGLKIDLPVVS
jgi:tRNA-2-methylthio-N6-dimethylallyladenosine synthase